MDLWNGDDRPPQNPFEEEDERSQVWTTLVEMEREGQIPVFVDLDGNTFTFNATEFVAKKTLASMSERNNNFGDGFLDTGLYYSWLNIRLNSNYQILDPWLKTTRPESHARMETIKTSLTPPWLGGDERGIGPWPSAAGVQEAHPQVLQLAELVVEDHSCLEDLCQFADIAIGLDRDALTGIQTYWIKLLRELDDGARLDVLNPLEVGWIHLNLVAPDHPDFERVSPSDAPLLQELKGHPTRVSLSRYNRALALAEVVDHTLDGLGLSQRRAFVAQLKDGIRLHSQELSARDQRMLALFGDDYGGLPVEEILRGRFDRDNSQRRLAKLQRAVLSSPHLTERQRMDAEAHLSLMDWLINVDVRYGDVDLGISLTEPIFRDDALAVGEYFDQSPPARVTPVGPLKQVPVVIGNDTELALPVSAVFEGGGGKGFAYPEVLKNVVRGLEESGEGFHVDEFVGTSSGAMTAVFLAAGFSPGELRDLLAQIDFRDFNSDAAWLMGGVDPKVRGIDRTGLFSLQRMYQTIYKLLSEKLGIEGRPILFRDLPHRCTMVATLLNTDLPQDDPLLRQVDIDGRFVMSTERTPNFDVVGAIWWPRPPYPPIFINLRWRWLASNPIPTGLSLCDATECSSPMGR